MAKKNKKLLRGDLPLKIMTFQTLSVATLVSQVLVFLLSTKVGFFPSEDALMNIVSSFAEITAGLYGITLASYTFFLSRIDALSAADGTLDFVVEGIKKKFKYLIWHITLNVMMVLGITAVLKYSPVPERGQMYFYYRLFCNEFVVFISFSIGLILYYSVLVVNPNCIQSEAKRLKKKLSEEEAETGSVIEFLTLYGRLNQVCQEQIPQDAMEILTQTKGNQPSFYLMLLKENRPELIPLLPELNTIFRYYACVVNCNKLGVTEEMCRRARMLLDKLEGREPEAELPDRENTEEDVPTK